MKSMIDELILLNPSNVNDTLNHVVNYTCQSYIKHIEDEYSVKIIKITNMALRTIELIYDNNYIILAPTMYKKDNDWKPYDCDKFKEIYNKIFKLDEYFLNIYVNNSQTLTY